jgi:nucleolin
VSIIYSSDEEEAKPGVKKAAPAKKTPAKADSSSEDSSDDEEPAKPAAKAVAAKPVAKKAESSDDDSSSDEEEEAKPATKVSCQGTRPGHVAGHCFIRRCS